MYKPEDREKGCEASRPDTAIAGMNSQCGYQEQAGPGLAPLTGEELMGHNPYYWMFYKEEGIIVFSCVPAAELTSLQ